MAAAAVMGSWMPWAAAAAAAAPWKPWAKADEKAEVGNMMSTPPPPVKDSVVLS